MSHKFATKVYRHSGQAGGSARGGLASLKLARAGIQETRKTGLPFSR